MAYQFRVMEIVDGRSWEEVSLLLLGFIPQKGMTLSGLYQSQTKNDVYTVVEVEFDVVSEIFYLYVRDYDEHHSKLKGE